MHMAAMLIFRIGTAEIVHEVDMVVLCLHAGQQIDDIQEVWGGPCPGSAGHTVVSAPGQSVSCAQHAIGATISQSRRIIVGHDRPRSGV